MKIKNMFSEMFSMQEKRISTIIICLLVFVGVSVYLYIARNDIPDTLLTLLQTHIYVVGGVNGLNIATKFFKKNEDVDSDVVSYK